MIEKAAVAAVGVGAHVMFAQPHWSKYFELSGQEAKNPGLVQEFSSGQAPFEAINNYAHQMALNTQAGREALPELWTAVGYDVAIAVACTAAALLFMRGASQTSNA